MPKQIFEYSSGLKRTGRGVEGPERAFLESWLGKAEVRLRPALADVPRQLKRLCKDWWFPGECFPRAICFVRTNPKLPTSEYILGEALSGGLGQHGWVEYEDLVFDPVLQEWYRKEGYYASEIANPWYRFSRPATMYLARQMDKLAESTFRWIVGCNSLGGRIRQYHWNKPRHVLPKSIKNAFRLSDKLNHEKETSRRSPSQSELGEVGVVPTCQV